MQRLKHGGENVTGKDGLCVISSTKQVGTVITAGIVIVATLATGATMKTVLGTSSSRKPDDVIEYGNQHQREKDAETGSLRDLADPG